MKDFNSEETLWVALPILIVVGLLVASIIILPETQTNTSSRASTPTVTPTPVVISTPTASRPEVICSSLYSPVCSQNGVTYPNECEANQAGVTAFTKGECSKTVTTPTQKIVPVVLPTSD